MRLDELLPTLRAFGKMILHTIQLGARQAAIQVRRKLEVCHVCVGCIQFVIRSLDAELRVSSINSLDSSRFERIAQPAEYAIELAIDMKRSGQSYDRSDSRCGQSVSIAKHEQKPFPRRKPRELRSEDRIAVAKHGIVLGGRSRRIWKLVDIQLRPKRIYKYAAKGPQRICLAR